MQSKNVKTTVYSYSYHSLHLAFINRIQYYNTTMHLYAAHTHPSIVTPGCANDTLSTSIEVLLFAR